MKAHYQTFSVTKIDKEIRKGVKQELTKYKDDIYDKVTWDVFQQALACCFIALEQMGWGKKRLTDYALQHMKDKYGIDLNESQYKEEYDRDDEAKGGKK